MKKVKALIIATIVIVLLPLLIVEVKAEGEKTYAYLPEGSVFNVTLTDNFGYDIEYILKDSQAPANNVNTINIAVMTPDDALPLYVWYDDTIKTLYYYTEATNIMMHKYSYYAFSNLDKLKRIDLSIFDTSKVESMYSLFNNDKNLESLDLSNFDTSNVTEMIDMFNGCTNLKSINFSENIDTSKVIYMDHMFSGCENLEDIDLSNFNTSKVEDMSYMFNECSRLESLDLSNFDTSNLKNMEGMFAYCDNLTDINLSNFNTSKVTNMYALFNFMASIKYIDISSFTKDSLTSANYMFSYLPNLERIYVSDSFDLRDKGITNVFDTCNNLIGEKGTIFSSTNDTLGSEYAHIDGGEENPGYFTRKENLNVVFISFEEEFKTKSVLKFKPVTIDETDVPLKDGYTFIGWYKDQNYETKYNNDPIAENTTLYAKFKKNVNARMEETVTNASMTVTTLDDEDVSNIGVFPGTTVIINITPNKEVIFEKINIKDKDGNLLETKTTTSFEYVLTNDVVIEPIFKFTYKIIQGDNQKYILGSKKDVIISSNGELSKLISIEIDDGNIIDSSNYILESGSTILTLKSNFLEKMSVGKHTITFRYNDGESVSATLNIVENNTSNPETGDNILFYISMFGLSIIGFAGSTLCLKKREN